MWIVFALISSLSLGFYDVFKKLALDKNNVFAVLFLNTVFCTLFMSPVLFTTYGEMHAHYSLSMSHLLIFIKALIVTTSWLLGYFAIKNLPLTIQGSINAFRPVLVLLGALIIFGERPNLLQWAGIALGFVSLLWVGFIGRKEGIGLRKSRWMWYGLLSVILWAASGLYDKFLMTNGFKPLNVEAWYSFYQFVIMLVVMLFTWNVVKARESFKWHWSILLISVFICIADLTYFYALAEPGSLVSVASMLRRGSALVAFFYGVMVLGEKNVRLKIVDQCILIAGVMLMILGSI